MIHLKQGSRKMADHKDVEAITNRNALDSARKLQRRISLTVERQAKTLEASRDELAAIEAYIRGLEKTK